MADIANKLTKESANLAGAFVEVKTNTSDFGVALTDATKKMADFSEQYEQTTSKLGESTKSIMESLKGALSKAGGAFKKIPGLTKMAALGPLGAITSAATLLFKQLMQVSDTIAGISKDTGLIGKQLKAVFKEVKLGAGGLHAFGIGLQDAGKQASALVDSLGNAKMITSGLIDVTARVAKAMGGSAQESAALADNLIRGFGKTSKQVESFAENMMTFATKSGVNARKVMRDISNDSNLTAIYLSRGEDYMAKTAVMAAKMGKSMADNLSTTDAFLNIESGSDLTGRLNQFFGSNLNALKLYNMAVKQDTIGVHKELNKVFSTPKGMAQLEKYPGIAKQLGAELGLNVKDMRQLGKVIGDMEKTARGPTKEQQKLNDFIMEGMTLWEQLKGLVASALLPLFTELGTMLNDKVKPLMNEATKMASAFGKAISESMDSAKGLGPKLKAAFGVIATTLSPIFTTIGNKIGSAFMNGVWGWFKNSPVGVIIGAMIGGGAIGAAAGPWGAAAGAVLAGGAAAYGLATNATGQVHSSPTLALVGEEHRSEVVIPTERIRKGMPVSNSVSRELQSIGVPGFNRGGVGASAVAATSISASQRKRSQSQMIYGSQGDPNAIKRREQQIEYQAQQDRAAQRELVEKIMKEVEAGERAKYFNDPRGGADLGGDVEIEADKKGKDKGRDWEKTIHRLGLSLDHFMKLSNTTWKDMKDTLPNFIDKTATNLFNKLPGEIQTGLTTGTEVAWNHYLDTGNLQEALAKGAAEGIRTATEGMTVPGGEFTKAAGNIVAGMFEGKSWRKGLGEEMSKSMTSKDGALNKTLGKLNAIAGDSNRSSVAQAAAAGGASALSAGVDTFAATGSFKEAGKSALISGAGSATNVGVTAALSATPLAPIAPLLGSIAGSLVSGGLGGFFGGGKDVLTGPAARGKVLGGLSSALRLARKPGGQQLYEAFKSGTKLNKMARKDIDAAMLNSNGEMDQGLRGQLISGAGNIIQRTTGMVMSSDEIMTLLSALKGTNMQGHEQKNALTQFERRFEGAGARGAIVNRPTVALIGEAGPEVVTPLDQTRGNGPLPGGSGGDLAGEIRQMNRLLAQYVSNPPPINIDGQRVSRVINAANSDDIRTGVSTVNSRI